MRSALHVTRLVVLAIAALLLAPAPSGASVVVLVKTNLRQLDPDLPYKFYAVLYTQAIPTTTGNFLNYALSGLFRRSIIHRSVPGFVVQAGGFTYAGGAYSSVPVQDPIPLQAGLSNQLGTLAMARTQAAGPDLPTCEAYDNAADSATSQWFINLADNSASLDDLPHVRMRDEDGNPVFDDEGRPLYTSCGRRGYAVFGRVLGDGMDVVDAIAALPRESGQWATDEAPEITSQFRGLPVLHALDPGPFGNGCAQVLEPLPDSASTENIVYDDSCTEEEQDASLAARQAALRDVLPGELVKVNKVKVVPLLRGSDRIVLDDFKTQIRHSDTGDVSRARGSVDSGFQPVEWVFSLGDTTWEAIDTRDYRYGSEVWDRRGKRTVLAFDEASTGELADLLEARTGASLLSVLGKHEDNFRALGLPDCAPGGVLLVPPAICFSLSDTSRITSLNVSFPDLSQARFRVREDHKRNLFKVHGSIPFEAEVQVRIAYFEKSDESSKKRDRTVRTKGSYEFFLSGPIRHHRD